MKTQKLALILLAVITLVCFAACNNPWWPNRGDVTVDFNPNGGMGTPPPAQSVTDGESIIVPTSNGLTRNGFYFDGWNTKVDYSGKDYYVGQSYKTAGNATLFARWITAGSSPYYYHPYFTPYGSDNSTTGSNRRNPGGSSASTGLKVTYHPEIPGSGISPNIIARATIPKPGTVKGAVPVDPNAYKEGDPVTVLDGSHLTRSGYEFAEWVDHEEFIDKGGSLSSGSKFTIENHTNLYALWLEEDKVIKIGKTTIEKKFTFDPQLYVYPAFAAEPMTILNTGPDSRDTGKLTVSIEYQTVKINGVDECPFVITGIANGQEIASIAKGAQAPFWIKPRDDLPVGNYSVIVRIYDDPVYDQSEFYACFIAGFVVNPRPLVITASAVNYNDTGNEDGDPDDPYFSSYKINALTPIKAGAYTERTATFSVTVSGFVDNAHANDVTLAFAVPGLGFTGNDTIGPAIGGTKTFDAVKVEYNGTAEFDSGGGEANIALDGMIGLGLESVNQNYYISNLANSYVPINVRDGQADTTNRVIYVNTVNNMKLWDKDYKPYNVDENWDDYYDDGNMTPFNAYATGADTADLTWQHALSLNYKQVEDIDLGFHGSRWTRIGTDAGHAFSGSYDGGGNTISGLIVEVYGETNVGMIGYLTGTVKDLTLEGVSITSETNINVGAVAGYSAGTVKDIKLTSETNATNIGGDYNFGGMVGFNDTGGLVEDCVVVSASIGADKGEYTGGVVGLNKGTVKGSKSSASNGNEGGFYVGGVVGYNDGATALVEDCSSTSAAEIRGVYGYVGGVLGGNSGTVRGSSSSAVFSSIDGYLGGVVGWNSGTVANCHYDGSLVESNGGYVGGVVGYNEGGTVTGSNASGNVTGTHLVGGVVGRNDGNGATTGIVQSCYASGSVEGTESKAIILSGSTNNGAFVGGVVGLNDGGKVTRSAFTGINITSAGSRVGGVAGYNNNSSTVEYCYAAGIIIRQHTSGWDVGGVAGWNYGTVENCYATGEITSNNGTNGTVGGVVGHNDGLLQFCYAVVAVNNPGTGGGVAAHQQNGNGTVINCVALGSVIGRNADVGRVVGSNQSGTITNNYAKKDMLVNGSSTSNTSTNAGSKNGADITDTQWNSAAWWTGTAKFSGSVWYFDELGTYLPKLRNMPGGVNETASLAMQKPKIQP